MITNAHCQMMARYNEWMNARLYAVCADLSDDELRRDRGAFFKSIYLTLNHIVYGDLAFLSRLSGTPAAVPELGADLFGSFANLRREREAIDARLLQWTASLTPEWLADALTYTSKVDGKSRTIPRWVIVTHMFNHQTHHRGQLTTLLSQIGMDVGSTDIPFMPGFEKP
jgi:uncharacterized damage-inducible protein DinB